MEVYKIITLSFIISFCCTLVEMFASRGTDNILIPATAYLLLKSLSALDVKALLPVAAILGILFFTCIVAKTAEITTFYCAARYSVMAFMAFVLVKTHNPLAAPFVMITLVSLLFVGKTAMTSSFGIAFFSIACAALSTAALPMTIIFAVGNSIILFASAQNETERTIERREKYEPVGNPVVARG